MMNWFYQFLKTLNWIKQSNTFSKRPSNEIYANSRNGFDFAKSTALDLGHLSFI